MTFLALTFPYLCRLTIWTAVIVEDIDITVRREDEAEEFRTITKTNIIWLLVTGWMFYFGSLILNLAYYMMHPSSPEMWTWGAVEELEEWSPPGERETEKRQANNRNQPEASNIEMTELLPTGSNGDLQTDETDDSN